MAARARDARHLRRLLGRRVEPVDIGAHLVQIRSIQLGMRVRKVDCRTGRNCVFALHVHLVFIAKYRRDVLPDSAIRDLRAIFAKVCARTPP